MQKRLRNPDYQKGRDFETALARAVRRILGIPAWRDKASGAGWFKADLHIPTLHFHVEVKNHKTIKLGEFWEQTRANKGYKTPMLIVNLDGYTALACMEFEDLLNLVKQISDDTDTIKQLREEISALQAPGFQRN